MGNAFVGESNHQRRQISRIAPPLASAGLEVFDGEKMKACHPAVAKLTRGLVADLWGWADAVLVEAGFRVSEGMILGEPHAMNKAT
jgi:hypothetical protein